MDRTATGNPPSSVGQPIPIVYGAPIINVRCMNLAAIAFKEFAVRMEPLVLRADLVRARRLRNVNLMVAAIYVALGWPMPALWAVMIGTFMLSMYASRTAAKLREFELEEALGVMPGFHSHGQITAETIEYLRHEMGRYP